MNYKILVKTVVVSETGHTSVVQNVIEFATYTEANEAYNAINPPEKDIVNVFDTAGIAKSKTSAIRMYKVN